MLWGTRKIEDYELQKIYLKNPSVREKVLSASLVSLEKIQDIEAKSENFHEFLILSSKVREHSLNNLPNLLKEFRLNAEKNGFFVHYANNNIDALKIVEKILSEKGINKVLKSKSMTTEEINLNEFLNEKGIEVLETDLGELIIQLSGEKPSHITAPAIHKSREDIRDILERKLGYSDIADPHKITEFVRNYLRREFLSSKAGITGANFLIAKEGAVVIVENEGNARMTYHLPNLHIVIAGIEKIIEDYNSLYPLMRVISVKATGQIQPSYFSIIRKPPRRRETHIILLDNGRWDIYKNPRFREILKCIRCGACSYVCPIFASYGGIFYQSVYSGPIGILWSYFIFKKKHLAYLSTTCGACDKICPVGISITKLIVELRKELRDLPPLLKILIKLWNEILWIFNFIKNLKL